MKRHTINGEDYSETGIFRIPFDGEWFLSPVFDTPMRCNGSATKSVAELRGVGRVRHILRKVKRPGVYVTVTHDVRPLPLGMTVKLDGRDLGAFVPEGRLLQSEAARKAERAGRKEERGRADQAEAERDAALERLAEVEAERDSYASSAAQSIIDAWCNPWRLIPPEVGLFQIASLPVTYKRRGGHDDCDYVKTGEVRYPRRGDYYLIDGEVAYAYSDHGVHSVDTELPIMKRVD